MIDWRGRWIHNRVCFRRRIARAVAAARCPGQTVSIVHLGVSVWEAGVVMIDRQMNAGLDKNAIRFSKVVRMKMCRILGIIAVVIMHMIVVQRVVMWRWMNKIRRGGSQRFRDMQRWFDPVRNGIFVQSFISSVRKSFFLCLSKIFCDQIRQVHQKEKDSDESV